MTAVTILGGDAGAAPFSIVATGNSPPGPAGRLLAFALPGARLASPFAGLEMAAPYPAFRHVARHSGDFEIGRIVGEERGREIARALERELRTRSVRGARRAWTDPVFEARQA
ncbi:MAG: hypothetical protein IT529_04425 [Burkholderiales bacterium]|nr:hypothetical protein [Burkholderiales bacterium]